MQLVYNTYSFPQNGVEFSVSVDLLWSDVGQFYGNRVSFHVRGHLLASLADTTIALQQSDLTAQQNALTAALAVQYGNLTFNQDSGSKSADFITSNQSITGVRVLYLRFPSTNNSEYATQRTFECGFEAEIPAAGSANYALSFSETLRFSGGGPIYIFRNNLLGTPQKQMTYPQTPYVCVQSGAIVGYQRRLQPPPPKFPAALMYAPTITPRSPTRRGPGGYSSFETTYEYHMESAAPFGAVAPTIWTGTGYG